MPNMSETLIHAMPATVDDTGIQLHFLQKDWTNFLRFCLVLQNTQHYKIINSNIAVQLRTMYLSSCLLRSF